MRGRACHHLSILSIGSHSARAAKAESVRTRNFSDWGNRQSHGHGHDGEEEEEEDLAEEIAKSIKEGYMPLEEYLWLHPEAQLTNEEKGLLIEGLMETVRNSPEN